MSDVQQETKPKSNKRKLSTYIKKRASTIRKSFIKSEKDVKESKEQDKVDSDKSETISNADENTEHKQNGVAEEHTTQPEERKTVRFVDTETEQTELTELTEKPEPKSTFLYQFGEFDESILDREEEEEIVVPPPLRKEAPKEQNLLFSYDSDSDNSSPSEKEDNTISKQHESSSDEEVAKTPTPTVTAPTTLVEEPIAIPTIMLEKSEHTVSEIEVQTEPIEITESHTPRIVEPQMRVSTSEIEIQTDSHYDLRVLITAEEKSSSEISTQTDVSQLEETPVTEIKSITDSVSTQTEETQKIEVNIGTDPIPTSHVQVGTEKIITTHVRVGTEHSTKENATSTEFTSSQDTTTDTTDLIHYEEKEIYTEPVLQDPIPFIEPEQMIPVSPSKGPREFMKGTNSVDELSTTSPMRGGSPLRVVQWNAATKQRQGDEYDDLEVLYRPSVLANFVSKQRKVMTPTVDKDLVGMLREFPENKSFTQKRK